VLGDGRDAVVSPEGRVVVVAESDVGVAGVALTPKLDPASDDGTVADALTDPAVGVCERLGKLGDNPTSAEIESADGVPTPDPTGDAAATPAAGVEVAATLAVAATPAAGVEVAATTLAVSLADTTGGVVVAAARLTVSVAATFAAGVEAAARLTESVAATFAAGVEGTARLTVSVAATFAARVEGAARLTVSVAATFAVGVEVAATPAVSVADTARELVLAATLAVTGAAAVVCTAGEAAPVTAVTSSPGCPRSAAIEDNSVVPTEACAAGAGSAELEPADNAAPRSDGAPVAATEGCGGGACNPPVSSAADTPRLSALAPGTEETFGAPRRPRLSVLEVVSQIDGSMPCTRPPPREEKDATSWAEASPRSAERDALSTAPAIDGRGLAHASKGCSAAGPMEKGPPRPPRKAPTAAKERPPAPTKAALRYRESQVGVGSSPTVAPTAAASVATVPSPEGAE
jgi:hypothetical protein